MLRIGSCQLFWQSSSQEGDHLASRDKQGPPVDPGRKQQANVQAKKWKTATEQKFYVESLKRVDNHINQSKRYLCI